MAVNEWWRNDPSERFWMEITCRDDLGGDLLDPQKKRDNRDYWSYDLVTYAMPGDVILHWSAQPELAVVGYSVVKASAVEDLMNWESPATTLKDRIAAGERAAWRLPLAAYRQLAEPVTLEEVRQHEEALRRVQEGLVGRTAGAIYFPFELSNKRPPRPAQGYLVKSPRRFSLFYLASQLWRSSPSARQSKTQRGRFARSHAPHGPEGCKT
jgi:hypothetical protein